MRTMIEGSEERRSEDTHNETGEEEAPVAHYIKERKSSEIHTDKMG